MGWAWVDSGQIGFFVVIHMLYGTVKGSQEDKNVGADCGEGGWSMVIVKALEPSPLATPYHQDLLGAAIIMDSAAGDEVLLRWLSWPSPGDTTRPQSKVPSGRQVRLFPCITLCGHAESDPCLPL
jgi:hypothetical protein